MHAVLGAADALDEPLLGLLGEPGLLRALRVPCRYRGRRRVEGSRLGPLFQVRLLTAYDPALTGRSYPFSSTCCDPRPRHRRDRHRARRRSNGSAASRTTNAAHRFCWPARRCPEVESERAAGRGRGRRRGVPFLAGQASVRRSEVSILTGARGARQDRAGPRYLR